MPTLFQHKSLFVHRIDQRTSRSATGMFASALPVIVVISGLLIAFCSDVSAQNDALQSPYQITQNPPTIQNPTAVQNQQANPYLTETQSAAVNRTPNPYALEGVPIIPPSHVTRRIPPVEAGAVRPNTGPYPAIPANPYARSYDPSQPQTPLPTVAPVGPIVGARTQQNIAGTQNSNPNTGPSAGNIPLGNQRARNLPARVSPAAGTTEDTRPFHQQVTNSMRQFEKPPEPARPHAAGQIMASVGHYVILAVDIEPLVMQILIRRARSIPRDQLPAQKEAITRQILERMIDQKLLYCDARQSLPEESIPQIEQQLFDRFDEFEIPRLLKAAGVTTQNELNEMLKQMGSSIEHRRTSFLEQALATQWMQEQIQHEFETTYSDLLLYYQKHTEEFRLPAETVWEHLMVNHTHQPSKREGYAALARMGNEVQVDGRSLADVAREKSQGPTAADGGRCTWPCEMILSSTVERAIEELPVGRLSPIIEDWRGFHIIHIVERKPERIAPFPEVQEDIRKKIRIERAQIYEKAYLARLRRDFHVWTIFDSGSPESQQNATRIGSRDDRGSRQ